MSFERGVRLEGGSEDGGDNPSKQTLVSFLFLFAPLPFPFFSSVLLKNQVSQICIKVEGDFCVLSACVSQAFCEA